MELSVDHVIDYEYMIRWESSAVLYENLTLPPGCWRYRGEGNANVVIALKQEASIIRLSKNYNDVSWTEQQKKKVERQVIFTKHIFTPLFGDCFVAKVRAVYIPPDQISQLNECLGRIRPSHRMQKELKVPYATAHSDFARILKFSSDDVDYCVEIKPKKGWWFKPKGTEDVAPQVCTYCLNQFLKLKKSKISARSNYCPLDLFSGDPSRTVHAVISLLANPQNNLRIFRDGYLVYSDSNRLNNSNSLGLVTEEWMSGFTAGLAPADSEIGCLQNLVYLICVALLKPQQQFQKGSSRFLHLMTELREVITAEMSKLEEILSCKSSSVNEVTWKKCKSESLELPAGSVLSKVLNAQKLEETEGKYKMKLFKLFRTVCPLHSGGKFSKAEIIGNSHGENCPTKKCMSSEAWLDEVWNEKLLQPKDLLCIQRHLLAATVKDCSIMLTFSSVPSMPNDWSGESDHSIVPDLHGQLRYYKVGIVDLDPKPLSALVKHHLREEEMLEAYYDALEG